MIMDSEERFFGFARVSARSLRRKLKAERALQAAIVMMRDAGILPRTRIEVKFVVGRCANTDTLDAEFARLIRSHEYSHRAVTLLIIGQICPPKAVA